MGGRQRTTLFMTTEEEARKMGMEAGTVEERRKKRR